ncbi:MAG: hypothetical protein E7160_01530 [Firmicutes bacterium]|nr:hypothetical protein [Bacillota bacterium]
MKDSTILLLKMIKDGRTLNEISEALNLSNKQLFMRLSMLKHSGFNFDKVYNYNGDIQYAFDNQINFNENTYIHRQEKNVIVPEDTKTIRAVLISDTHIGNVKEELALIDRVMDYCAKEDIHIILHAGDFFEGIYCNKYKKNCKYSDPREQISYGLNAYPYDKNILTFALLGNHDATFWLRHGIDIKTILEERRHDIIPIGYGYGEMTIGGCRIRMKHEISRKGISIIPSQNISNKIVLKGHSHKYKVVHSDNSLTVYVPTASRVETDSVQSPIPSIIDMKLTLKNNKVTKECFEQYIFIDNKLVRVSENNYSIKLELENKKHQEREMKIKWKYPKLKKFTCSDSDEIIENINYEETEYNDIENKPVQKVKK